MSTKALSVEVIDAQNFKIVIPSEAISLKERALEKAKGILLVSNGDEQTKAIQSVAILKGIVQEVEKLREDIKRPFWNAGKAIDAKAKEYSETLVKRISEIETLIAGFQRKERERVEAAQRAEEQRRKDAEAAAQRERDRLAEIERQKAAAKTKAERDRLAAEQAQAEIDSAEAQDDLAQANATTVIPEAAQATGAAVSFLYSYEITDIEKFALWDIERRRANPRLPQMTKIEIVKSNLNDYIKIVGLADIPGIKVKETTRTAVRAVAPSIALE